MVVARGVGMSYKRAAVATKQAVVDRYLIVLLWQEEPAYHPFSCRTERNCKALTSALTGNMATVILLLLLQLLVLLLL